MFFIIKRHKIISTPERLTRPIRARIITNEALHGLLLFGAPQRKEFKSLPCGGFWLFRRQLGTPSVRHLHLLAKLVCVGHCCCHTVLYILTSTGGHATLTAFFKLCSKRNAVRVACPPSAAGLFRDFARFKKPFFRFILSLLQRLVITLIIQELPFKISDLWR